MLTTKTKVSLAVLAYKFVAIGRGVLGKDNCAIVRRGGVRWCLDLTEGIDFSIYLLGAFERSTVATLRKLVRPGDTVFDIGANIGAHTLGMAHSVGPAGRVFAFEPADFAFTKLKRNLALNPELEARTHPQQMLLAAAPAMCAQKEIYASWPLAKGDSVHPKHRGRLVTTRNATVGTLDLFVQHEGIDRLDLIKIDVDGHELPVLQGGLGVLARFQPVLVMEMSPYVHAEEGRSFAALIALLRDAEYTILDASSWKPLPLEAGKLEALIPDGASINVIARSDRALDPSSSAKVRPG
jgi:FkbM family methyltransferase